MRWIIAFVLLCMMAGEVFAASAKKEVAIDWASFFGDDSGCAVFYEPARETYYVYGGEKVDVRNSPCSTFKIISSLLGWKKGVITQGKSIRKWSGEHYWKEDWNRDIGFSDAFRCSCIWYFREVIDEMGASFVKSELEQLHYGNGDVSDWDGLLNTNEENRILKGFWVESSLTISPREQVQVLNKIFGKDSLHQASHLMELKQAMLIDQKECPAKIYGKTGPGKKGKKFADAWFVGLMEKDGRTIYFAVHLDSSNEPNTASLQARKIAIQLASWVLAF